MFMISCAPVHLIVLHIAPSLKKSIDPIGHKRRRGQPKNNTHLYLAGGGLSDSIVDLASYTCFDVMFGYRLNSQLLAHFNTVYQRVR